MQGRLLWVSRLRFHRRRDRSPGGSAAFVATCNGAKELVCLRVTASSRWGFVDGGAPVFDTLTLPSLYAGHFATSMDSIASKLPMHIAAGTALRATFLCRVIRPCCRKDGKIVVPIESLSVFPPSDTPPTAVARPVITTEVSFSGERYIGILRSIARVGLELFLRDILVHTASSGEGFRLEADHFSDLRLLERDPSPGALATLSPVQVTHAHTRAHTQTPTHTHNIAYSSSILPTASTSASCRAPSPCTSTKIAPDGAPEVLPLGCAVQINLNLDNVFPPMEVPSISLVIHMPAVRPC
jgi:hypothetical protein